MGIVNDPKALSKASIIIAFEKSGGMPVAAHVLLKSDITRELVLVNCLLVVNPKIPKADQASWLKENWRGVQALCLLGLLFTFDFLIDFLKNKTSDKWKRKIRKQFSILLIWNFYSTSGSNTAQLL